MRHIYTLLLAVAISLPLGTLCDEAQAEPHKVSSPDLRPIKVKTERSPGRLIIYANYTTHRVLLDDAEVPSYLSDIGIEVSSNELHKVKIVSDNVEREYKISVNPGETMALYVDLGGKKAATTERKEEKATKGFLSVTAETEAQVYVDGKLVASKSPLKKQEVSSGSHTVRVYFLDTKKFSKSREVYVGKDASMSVHFSKE